MKRYIALLRGINISGKNRIAMADLKAGWEKLGYVEVKTYLNSGNLVFSSSGDDKALMYMQLEQMLKDSFGLNIPVYVISMEALEDLLAHAPAWWGNDDKEIYDNLIFIMHTATFAEVFREIGNPKDGLEKIENYKDAVFWSFSRKDYQKTNWWSKTASAEIGKKLTIRTANTLRKICKM